MTTQKLPRNFNHRLWTAQLYSEDFKIVEADILKSKAEVIKLCTWMQEFALVLNLDLS